MRLSKAMLAQIVEDVDMAARDNARETEGVPFSMSADGRSREYGPEIQEAYAASVRSIGESIQSAREWTNYALPRVLSHVEAKRVVTVLLRRGY
jgi:hypothetical protein